MLQGWQSWQRYVDQRIDALGRAGVRMAVIGAWLSWLEWTEAIHKVCDVVRPSFCARAYNTWWQYTVDYKDFVTVVRRASLRLQRYLRWRSWNSWRHFLSWQQYIREAAAEHYEMALHRGRHVDLWLAWQGWTDFVDHSHMLTRYYALVQMSGLGRAWRGWRAFMARMDEREMEELWEQGAGNREQGAWCSLTAAGTATVIALHAAQRRAYACSSPRLITVTSRPSLRTMAGHRCPTQTSSARCTTCAARRTPMWTSHSTRRTAAWASTLVLGLLKTHPPRLPPHC